MKPSRFRLNALHCRCIVFVCFALALGLNELIGSPPRTCPIPLEKGVVWTYEGKVQWTVIGSAKVKTAKIRWTTEVVDVIKGSKARVAIIRGFPDELCWYEPGQTPGLCVLLSVSNSLYRLGAGDEKRIRILALRLAENPHALPQSAEQLLEAPLAVGRHWGQEPARDDTWYCWCVEEAHAKAYSVAGFPSRRPMKTYRLAYRTLPDHQFFEIVPDVGVVGFVYGHHGTVASADVHLISFSRPGDSSAQRRE